MIKPTLNVLSEDQKNRIHRDALEILSAVGIHVESSRARSVLQKAIGSNVTGGDIIKLPSETVEEAIKMTMPSVDIFNRLGEACIHLPGEAKFGLGVTTLYYQDPQTDRIHPFNRKHVETSVRLGHELSNFDFVATPGIIQDAPPQSVDAYTTLEMVANTTKPLVILVSRSEALADVLDLLEYLYGELSDKPFVVPLMTPITPLFIDAGTSDRMFASIERGIPFIYVNYGMAGANTPITPYGSLTLLMAEILAGIALSQFIQPGAKIIAGCLNAFMDMRTMLNFYDPMSYLLNLACGEMMDFYRIPHYGNSGNAVGWGSDIIAAGHQWMNLLLACIGKAGMAVFVGTVLGSKVFSPKLAVYANEIISQARRISKGFEIDDGSSLMGEIAAAGPAGNFLASDMTLTYFKQAYFQSDVFPAFTMEDWQSAECPTAENYLRQYTRDMIDSFIGEDEKTAIIEKGNAFLSRKYGY